MVKRGEIYWCDLEPAVGTETRKRRPCLVVQRTPVATLPMRIVCPLIGANGRAGDRLNPFIPLGTAGLSKDSRVACHQLRALDLSRFGRLIGTLSPEQMAEVDSGLRLILDLGR